MKSALLSEATGVEHVVRCGHDSFGYWQKPHGLVEFPSEHPVPILGDVIDEMSALARRHPNDNQLGQTAEYSADRVRPRHLPRRTDHAPNGHACAGYDFANPSPLGGRIKDLTASFGLAPDAAALATGR